MQTHCIFLFHQQMPGAIKFLSAADIPGTNAFLQPPLALFEPQPVSNLLLCLCTELYT